MKKRKEGGSTWFNRRQTEIPLFKINKKKERERQTEEKRDDAGGKGGRKTPRRRCGQIRNWISGIIFAKNKTKQKGFSDPHCIFFKN